MGVSERLRPTPRALLSAAWRHARDLVSRPAARASWEPQPPPFLAVRGPCDLACAWCNFGHGAAVQFGSDAAHLHDELRALYARGHRHVGFGILHTEPTTSPDFVRIVRMARSIGFDRITLSTSGVKLARREYADELARAGLTHVVLSLPGGDTALSDLLLARDGAAGAKLQALSNCLAAGLRTHAILMFLRPALPELPEAALQLTNFRTWRSRRLLQLSGCLMDPVPGIPRARYSALWPRYGEVAWALRRLRRAVAGFELFSSELPVCVRKRIAGVVGEANERRCDELRFVKPSCCEGCTSSHCLGVYEEYWACHGAPLIEDSGESPPSRTDVPALRRLLIDSGGTSCDLLRGSETWARELESALERYHSGGELIADYRLESAHQEGGALITEWRSASDRMELSIEPRSQAPRFYVAGDRFALSYRSGCPVDSPARERLVQEVLAVLQR